jgi:hypothetical protein
MRGKRTPPRPRAAHSPRSLGANEPMSLRPARAFWKACHDDETSTQHYRWRRPDLRPDLKSSRQKRLLGVCRVAISCVKERSNFSPIANGCNFCFSRSSQHVRLFMAAVSRTRPRTVSWMRSSGSRRGLRRYLARCSLPGQWRHPP